MKDELIMIDKDDQRQKRRERMMIAVNDKKENRYCMDEDKESADRRQ